MILSDRSGRIRTRELEEEALRNDWTIYTNLRGRKRYEVIGAAKLAHRISKVIAQLKSTMEGTEGNNCCWKN